jgi:hypothetical protein
VPTFADRGVSHGQRGGSHTVINFSFLDRSRYFLSSSSSFILMRPSGLCSRPTATQKIWQCRKSNPGPLGLQPGSLAARPQRWPICNTGLLIYWSPTVVNSCTNVLHIEKQSIIINSMSSHETYLKWQLRNYLITWHPIPLVFQATSNKLQQLFTYNDFNSPLGDFRGNG